MSKGKLSSQENFLHINQGFSTRSLHAGEHQPLPGQIPHTGAIFQSSTFIFSNAKEGADIFSGEKSGYAYTRLGNPTVKTLEAKLSALEAGELTKKHPDTEAFSIAFSTGMASVSSTLLALSDAQDTILLGTGSYGATEHFSRTVLSRFNVNVVEVDTFDLNQVENAIKKHPKAKVILFETPTNPMLAVTDIALLTKLVKGVNPDIKVIVDNTFATPYLQRPLELGADVVLHSTTKYLCGHGTVVGGIATTTSKEIYGKILAVVKDIGTTPSPFDAWLVNLGIKTLSLRMEKHCENALAVAKFLSTHAKVESVRYPGLETDPYYQLARRQMKKPGGIICFNIAGGLESGRRLMDHIEVFSLAVSLGCIDSLIQHPASMTHACMLKEKREKAGITDGLVRISVGIEDTNDLLNALNDALAKV